jgi:pentatricopeptide repeat protein
VVSYNAAVSACLACAKYSEALRLVRRALEYEHYPNFSRLGRTEWDLHGIPLATACMLLAYSLLMMVLAEDHHAPSLGDIVVVTGKGLEVSPVVLYSIQRFQSS